MTNSASGVLICPSCKARAPTGAKTCPQCGARLRSLSGRKPRLPKNDPLFGQDVGGYIVTEVVGLGGMGRVYRAQDPTEGFSVAIKVLSTQASGDPHLLERFFKEAEVINQLCHPNIVEVYDVGVLPDGRPYIIMELLLGETLDKRLVARHRLEEAEAVEIMLPVCEALSAAHRQGITHRDLKPENIFLPGDEQGPIKVLDFGVAKLHGTDGDTRQTKSNMILGTPQYMAPEQARTPRDVDGRIDVYAVGVILFELLTGRLPFMSASAIALLFMHQEDQPPAPSSVVPEISPHMDRIVLRCLAKDPDHRYQQIEDLLAALQKAPGKYTLQMPPSSPRDFAPPPPEVDSGGTEVEIDIRSLPPYSPPPVSSRQTPAKALPPLPLPSVALSASYPAAPRAEAPQKISPPSAPPVITPPPPPPSAPSSSPPGGTLSASYPPAPPAPPQGDTLGQRAISDAPQAGSSQEPPPVAPVQAQALPPPPRLDQQNDLYDPIPRDPGDEESGLFAPTPSIVKLLPSPMSRLRQKTVRLFSGKAILFALGSLGLVAALLVVLWPEDPPPPPPPVLPPVYETPTRTVVTSPPETQKTEPDTEVLLRLRLQPKDARLLLWVNGAPLPPPEEGALKVPKGAEVEIVVAAPGYKPDYVALTAKKARDVVVSLGRGKPERAGKRE